MYRVPLALCVLGDRCFVGVTCVEHWLNTVSGLHRLLSRGGGGVMQQFGINETHEEAAH